MDPRWEACFSLRRGQLRVELGNGGTVSKGCQALTESDFTTLLEALPGWMEQRRNSSGGAAVTLTVFDASSLYLGRQSCIAIGRFLGPGCESNPLINRIVVMKLYKNNIGDEGARILANWLRTAEGLEELHLSHNQILDAGAVALLREAANSDRYPIRRSGCGLWCRLDRNWIDADRTLRRLPEEDKRLRVKICEDNDRFGAPRPLCTVLKFDGQQEREVVRLANFHRQLQPRFVAAATTTAQEAAAEANCLNGWHCAMQGTHNEDDDDQDEANWDQPSSSGSWWKELPVGSAPTEDAWEDQAWDPAPWERRVHAGEGRKVWTKEEWRAWTIAEGWRGEETCGRWRIWECEAWTQPWGKGGLRNGRPSWREVPREGHVYREQSSLALDPRTTPVQASALTVAQRILLAALREILSRTWAGNRGETYMLEHVGEACWSCVHGDVSSRRSQVMYDVKSGKVWWGRRLFSDPAELSLSGDTVMWYSSDDVVKHKPKVIWRRCQGGRPKLREYLAGDSGLCAAPSEELPKQSIPAEPEVAILEVHSILTACPEDGELSTTSAEERSRHVLRNAGFTDSEILSVRRAPGGVADSAGRVEIVVPSKASEKESTTQHAVPAPNRHGRELLNRVLGSAISASASDKRGKIGGTDHALNGKSAALAIQYRLLESSPGAAVREPLECMQVSGAPNLQTHPRAALDRGAGGRHSEARSGGYCGQVLEDSGLFAAGNIGEKPPTLPGGACDQSFFSDAAVPWGCMVRALRTQGDGAGLVAGRTMKAAHVLGEWHHVGRLAGHRSRGDGPRQPGPQLSEVGLTSVY